MIRATLRSALLATAAFVTPAILAPAQQPNPVPQNFRAVYPPVGAAQHQLQEALTLAAQQGKRVVLDFGTNKCASCQVTAGFFPEEHVHAQIAEHFLLVHINVGPKAHQNTDLAQRFGIDLSKGLPALAVLNSNGQPAGSTNEFRNAPNMSSNDLLEFLNKYRG